MLENIWFHIPHSSPNEHENEMFSREEGWWLISESYELQLVVTFAVTAAQWCDSWTAADLVFLWAGCLFSVVSRGSVCVHTLYHKSQYVCVCACASRCKCHLWLMRLFPKTRTRMMHSRNKVGWFVDRVGFYASLNTNCTCQKYI